MSTPYTWLTLPNAISALQGRLNAGNFWNPAELQIYLTEALRVRNSLCYDFKQDFIFPASGCQWNNLGSLAGSPRFRTVTDTALYTQMQYMLLEPPSGGAAWTGTGQFNLSKLTAALSNRRNEVIQAIGSNIMQLPGITSGVSTRRTDLPDSTLEARRVRFLMLMQTTTVIVGAGLTNMTVASNQGILGGQIVSGIGIAPGTVVVSVTGNNVILSVPALSALSNVTVMFYEPITLTREDTQAFQYFNPDYLQEQGIPQSWSVVPAPPLAFDTDYALILPGLMDVLILSSGQKFAPPANTLLGIPDDWSYLPMYGALSDLLMEEAESTDRQRGAYCRKRYEDGIKMCQDSNYLINATVNGQACATPALANKDYYFPEWETDLGQIPCIVQAGMDFVSVAPGYPSSASVNVVQNAPIFDPTGVYVQTSRDSWPEVLDYAHHLAAFKMGGQEFAETIPLLDGFFAGCKRDNGRIATYALYADVLLEQGEQQDVIEPRGYGEK